MDEQKISLLEEGKRPSSESFSSNLYSSDAESGFRDDKSKLEADGLFDPQSRQNPWSTYSPMSPRGDHHWHIYAKLALVGLGGFLLCFLLDRTFYMGKDTGDVAIPQPSVPANTSIIPYADIHVKPAGVKVIGFMFFGRPMFVNILDCYLRQNLVVNGGFLDEVHFVANTLHQEDLEYLDRLVEEVPQYLKINRTGSWFKLWNYTAELDPDTIVVKLDDDLVYLHQDAIPRVVTSLVEHPEAFAVAGHVVNNPHTHFWQYHSGALLPYLPEPGTDPVLPPSTWRASDLPRYTDEAPAQFKWAENKKPRSEKTRWLPLENTPANLLKTPAVNATWPNPKGGGTMFRYDDGYIDSWAMSAQVHYSLLDHLERENVEEVYAMAPEGRLWDQHYERYSINFVAVRAGEVANRNMWPQDEIAISMRIGKKLDKKFLIDTRALAAHYSFGTQHLLLKTDLLDRYLMYSNERVCGVDNQKEMIVSSMQRTAG